MKINVTEPLNRLLELLPMHAEEGRLRECVDEDMLASNLGMPEAPIIVAMARRILESLELLEKQELRNGRWAFVSFPASLAARSLFAAWAEPQQSLVESGYWESDSENPVMAEEQRTLLHLLETRRQRFNAVGAARPIRFVHVAWGIIRLGGRFLLHRREDRQRLGVPQFVLPGGRLRPSDLPEASQSAILRELAAENSPVAAAILPRTLIRELDEELGLHVDQDYSFEYWKPLKPFCAVEGSGNKHALTRYNFRLFHVRLTMLGETRLLERIAADPARFTWFSVEDMVNGCGSDGATAYLNALHADMGDDLLEQLEAVPEASSLAYRFADETTAVDLPPAPGGPFKTGKTGKEKDVLVPLDRQDWELILLLGWCTRSLRLLPNARRVQVLGGGWVVLISEADTERAKLLGTTLAAAGLPLLQFAGRAVRLSIHPDHLYFPDALFAYNYRASVISYGGQIELRLGGMDTCFGRLEVHTLSLPVPPLIAAVIEAIESGCNPASIKQVRDAGDLPRQNREAVSAKVRRLGLRRVIRIPGSEKEKDLRMHITVPRAD